MALLTSSNSNGFQTPLEILALGALCATAGRLAGRWERAAAFGAVFAVVCNLVLISTWRPGADAPVGGATLSVLFFGGTEEGQALDFASFDPRFASTSSWNDRSEAERDWERAADAVSAAVSRTDPDRIR